MEMKSPPPCPPTVTVRRNPPRKARATPSSVVPLREPLSSPSLSRDIFSTELPQNPNTTGDNNTDPSTRIFSENLKVYLRIRPLAVQKNSKNIAESKNAWPKNPKTKSNSRPKTKKGSEICLQVNEDLRSVTVSTPQALQETKKIKSEVFEGFSHVFASEASQSDVYEEMVKPLAEDFLQGKSGMFAAMGPSGSGKTHTVFGCAREPGMVPLALRHIFSETESRGTQLSRVFYLSMFEISSDKGKAERIIDLLHDGGDICMQKSGLKGLQEAVVCDAQQAESLIAHGMLKRATVMTNSNSQSSRSQCVINIRSNFKKSDEEVDGKASSTMLTIVDLAGAEREKKTGNQGARLIESNFINNTSMVFGLCLRSLLEHQKNRNKPLQKHYQNSLLTRYLRDYLEGKKRMILILTVKPGVEDYVDTSFLLRQGSPFTKIKFKTLEEPVNLTCNKRPNQAFPRAEQLKKMKFSNSETSLIDEGIIGKGFHLNMGKETAGKVLQDCVNQNIEGTDDENLNEVHLESDGFVALGIEEKSSLKGDYSKIKVEKDREYQIMQGLSKAMWTILKQYKKKLEGVEVENCHLRDCLTNEKTRSLDLGNELTSVKMRLFDVEKELNELKSQCTCCRKASSDSSPVLMCDASFNLSQCQMAKLQEVNSELSSYSFKEFEQTENEMKTDPSARDSIVISTSCSGGLEEHYPEQLEGLLKSISDAEDLKGFKDTCEVDVCTTSQEFFTSNNHAQHLICYEDMGIVDMSSRREDTCQLISACLYVSCKSEQDAVNMRDVKNFEPESEYVSDGTCLATSLECESAKSFQDCEDLKDDICEPTQLENCATGESSTLVDDRIVFIAPLLQSAHSSSESPQKDDICFEVDKKQLNNEEGKVNSEFSSYSLKELEQTEIEEKTDSSARDSVLNFTSCSGGVEEHCPQLLDQQVEGLLRSSNDAEDVMGCEDACTVDACSTSQELSTRTNKAQDLICYEDTGIVDVSSRREAVSQLTRVCLYTSHNSEEDAVIVVGDVKNLQPESECVSNGSCLATSLKCDSARSLQDCEDLNDAKGEQVQLENGATGDSPLLVDNHIVSLAAHSHTVRSSSESPCKDDICLDMDKEQLNNVEDKKQLEPLVTILSKEGGDAKNMLKFMPKPTSCSNFQHTEKPKRRLLPASSVLLKDISILDIKDDSDKPKGGKRGTMDDKNRTQGSLSLLNLLTSKLA